MSLTFPLVEVTATKAGLEGKMRDLKGEVWAGRASLAPFWVVWRPWNSG
jgi:hypothetical protein